MANLKGENKEMIKSMYAGVSGLRAHQSKMDVIGNNIANVNTWGYKTMRGSIESSFYQTLTAATDPSGGYGGGNPSQIGYGSQIGSVDVLHTASNFGPTGYPTDSMIEGNGYYLIGPKKVDADGKPINSYSDDGAIVPGAGYAADKSDELRALSLTRVGKFAFDGDGNLIAGGGNVVYGFLPTGTLDANGKPEYTTEAVPIMTPRVTSGNPAVTTGAQFQKITINESGVITGTNDAGEPVIIAKLAIASVPNPGGLEAQQGSTYKANANTGNIQAVEAGTRATGRIKSGGLEMANVDLANEFSEMITTQRGFQANTRIITVSDEMLQDLVNLKR